MFLLQRVMVLGVQSLDVMRVHRYGFATT